MDVATRTDHRRQVEAQRGDHEPGEFFGFLGGEEQAVEVLAGAGDLGRVRHPLPREGDASIRAIPGKIQSDRLRARPA